MSAAVVDASIAAKWLIAEPDSDLALALVGTVELSAPEIILAEVGNVLWKVVRLGGLKSEDAYSAATRLPHFIDNLVPIVTLLPRALTIAGTIDHPIYDCIYLALAERQGLPLVTADLRLARRVSGTALAAVVHPLASFMPR